MNKNDVISFVKNTLNNHPPAWLTQTTHRLDVYNENQAKFEFLQEFEALFQQSLSSPEAFSSLPTAYDYIRLGHPLSCVLEWTVAKLNNYKPLEVICFDSQTMPLLAILRKNLLDHKKTKIIFEDEITPSFNESVLRNIYGYDFDIIKSSHWEPSGLSECCHVFVSRHQNLTELHVPANIDFVLNEFDSLGSVLIVNGVDRHDYISDIQHVRRRESIAMTPVNCQTLLKKITGMAHLQPKLNSSANKLKVISSIQKITNTTSKALLSSCGLTMQYAILMGLIDDAFEKYPNKKIKLIVPPNCYGGTNDQARRVAASLNSVEVVDLAVDDGHNMVDSLDKILKNISHNDDVPFIVAEIPTNPRVEVPDLIQLKNVLSEERITKNGDKAVDPVFVLDQTFCPNVHFLGEGNILSSVRAISYVSGSKFPSGGLCTAGYCVANQDAETLLEKIDLHLKICDNEATALQIKILAEQMPSMNTRISEAYKNTREFVNFIHEVLPQAKINFVSEELAQQGFTPSVFSLDLPTKGDSELDKEEYKRTLNHQLIHLMIKNIPNESKHCVSYGQLKGCYWTIPATSTQGTTKEGDKDYIVRVSMSPELNVKKHKEIFQQFVQSLKC